MAEHFVEFDYDDLTKLDRSFDGEVREFVRGDFTYEDAQDEVVYRIHGMLGTYLEETKRFILGGYADRPAIYRFDGKPVSDKELKEFLRGTLEDALWELEQNSEAYLEEDRDDREDNPRTDSLQTRCNQLYPRPRHRRAKVKASFSYGTLALGAALGAAAMHFTMKPKQ